METSKFKGPINIGKDYSNNKNNKKKIKTFQISGRQMNNELKSKKTIRHRIWNRVYLWLNNNNRAHHHYHRHNLLG